MYEKYFKRLIDITISLILIVISSPILIGVYILLFITNQGKAFFFQQRPGYLGKPFFIIKFKTMNDGINKNGELLKDAERLTKIGKIIRKTSIDELPQLLNVIKGDLSLIGPRPLLMEYLGRYNQFQMRRHDVKPGITGWAQVNGRNAISWEKKFELDVWYVENISLKTDLLIVFKTILKILKSEGISAENSATMEKFMGTPTDTI